MNNNERKRLAEKKYNTLTNEEKEKYAIRVQKDKVMSLVASIICGIFSLSGFILMIAGCFSDSGPTLPLVCGFYCVTLIFCAGSALKPYLRIKASTEKTNIIYCIVKEMEKSNPETLYSDFKVTKTIELSYMKFLSKEQMLIYNNSK